MKLLCDVHTHTLFSRHAYSTIEECVRAASEKGLELLGSTDHFGNMLYDPPKYLDFQFFINRSMWPREWMGVKLLHGAEADIVDLDGHLYGWDYYVCESITADPRDRFTLLGDVCGRSDYTVASIHGKHWCEGATRSQLTNMYIQAMEKNPFVLILGHIGRSGLDIEFDPIIRAARDMNRLIEINEHSFSYDDSLGRCRIIAERCAELGCHIAVASDAHISCDIGELDNSTALLDEIHFPEELVASRNADAFVAAVKRAGLPDPLEKGGALDYN